MSANTLQIQIKQNPQTQCSYIVSYVDTHINI